MTNYEPMREEERRADERRELKLRTEKKKKRGGDEMNSNCSFNTAKVRALRFHPGWPH